MQGRSSLAIQIQGSLVHTWSLRPGVESAEQRISAREVLQPPSGDILEMGPIIVRLSL